MKFIHGADFHLERLFEGVGEVPLVLSEQLTKKNKAAFRKMIDLALNEMVDFVLLAGDTFHHAQIGLQTQAFFMEQMQILERAGIPVFLVFGNHDYYQKNRYWFSFPANVYAFTKEQVETVVFHTKQQEKVAVTAFSYQERWLAESKLPEFPSRETDVDFQIGIYHGEQGQTKAHQKQQYAPFDLAEMRQKGYDYWALGHIHQPEILSEVPLIAYAGTPVPHTQKEKSLGVLLVEMTKTTQQANWHALTDVEWKEVTIEVPEDYPKEELLFFISQQLSTQLLPKFGFYKLRLSSNNWSISQRTEMQSSAFLNHLQQMIYQSTNGQCWIHQLELYTNNVKPLPLGLSEAVFSQLGEKYQSEPYFVQLVESLLQQPVLAEYLPQNESERNAWVQQALADLIQDLQSEGGGE